MNAWMLLGPLLTTLFADIILHSVRPRERMSIKLSVLFLVAMLGGYLIGAVFAGILEYFLKVTIHEGSVPGIFINSICALLLWLLLFSRFSK